MTKEPFRGKIEIRELAFHLRWSLRKQISQTTMARSALDSLRSLVTLFFSIMGENYMAQMIPKQISSDTKSAAERSFFNFIRDAEGTEDWIVLHSVNIGRHISQTQGEADFIVFAPQTGIFVVEIKGGGISFCDGCWNSRDRNGNLYEIKNPVAEASGAMESLRKFVIDELSYKNKSAKNCLWGFCVVFPDGYFHNTYTIPDLADEQVADKTDMAHLDVFFRRLSEYWKKRCRVAGLSPCLPNVAACKDIIKILRPEIDFSVSLVGQAETVERQLIALTENQNDVFEGLAENDRCLIRGAAGTGKTILATNFFKKVSGAGANCAYFCYNKQLAAYVWEAIRPTVECCFHSYMESVAGAAFPDLWRDREADAGRYYSDILPERFIEAYVDSGAEPFDYLIVDEAQDLMNEKYLEVFDLILSGGLKNGKWTFFIDAENQNIYTGKSYEEIYRLLSRYGVYYTRYLLKDNCRNSTAIIEQVDKWFKTRTRTRKQSERGKEVEIKQYRHADQEQASVEEMLSVLTKKFPLSDIVILSPKRFDHSVVSGIDNYKISDSREEGAIFFSTIQAFKGLESKIVVLCDISDVSTEKARQYLYIGMTRAKSALYINISKRAYQQIQEEKEA